MSFENFTLDLVLDDLQSRFIVNIPDEELDSIERICFQIEQAHWFYEDFIRERNVQLPSFNLKKFSGLFFKHCPLLQHFADDHETAFKNFMEYKVRVPVCGAVILDQKCEKVLLVRGYKSSSSWSFPRGKINKDEKKSVCAAREVYEETGFDISPYINENEFVERTIREQRICLFIIPGISDTTYFETQTRKEIGDIQWFRLKDLPGWTSKSNINDNKYYMVTVFVTSIKNWIKKNARKLNVKANHLHPKSAVSTPSGYASGFDSDYTQNYSDPGTKSDFEYKQNSYHSADALKALLGIPSSSKAPMNYGIASDLDNKDFIIDRTGGEIPRSMFSLPDQSQRPQSPSNFHDQLYNHHQQIYRGLESSDQQIPFIQRYPTHRVFNHQLPPQQHFPNFQNNRLDQQQQQPPIIDKEQSLMNILMCGSADQQITQQEQIPFHPIQQTPPPPPLQTNQQIPFLPIQQPAPPPPLNFESKIFEKQVKREPKLGKSCLLDFEFDVEEILACFS